MSDSLDRDVAAVLDAEGLRVVRIQEVSTIRSPELRRRVFRVDLEGGETIKARRLEDSGTAWRLFDVRRDMPEAFVPAFLCRGPVLLERWVEGELLGHTAPEDGCLREAGLLLAALHAMPAVAGRPVHQQESTAPWRDEAERALGLLQGAGGLGKPEAGGLRRMLERHDPGLATVGLTHVDFCGENMLIDRTGRLRVFDNDRVGVGPLGFDLARARYRWALDAPAWERVQDAYASGTARTGAVETLRFWGVVAAAKSAAFRLRTDPARAHVPLDCLVRIAGQSDDGAPA